jgi:hypothetical protein
VTGSDKVLTDELLLVNKLHREGISCDAFAGDTYRQTRREKVRGAIKKNALSDKLCWKVNGRDRTYADAFLATYGESL